MIVIASIIPVLLSFSMAAIAKMSNMNGEYTISNPNTEGPRQFSTDFSTYHGVEYFDVYSPPITTRYGEVYWTLMDPVELPEDLVKRFDNRVMAVVGYEANQVTSSEGGKEIPVPITWAYNHHYLAYLKGKLSEVRVVKPTDNIRNHHHAKVQWHPFKKIDVEDPRQRIRPESGIPVIQLFSEGNGGEYRKSFHGYPRGTAQIIESPVAFQIEVMQIDTKNRDYNGTDFRAGPLPRISPTPPNASYSGLLECPCSTRIPRNYTMSYSTVTEGFCVPVSAKITSQVECQTAAKKLGLFVDHFVVVNNGSSPAYCYAVTADDGSTIVFFNTNSDSTSPCQFSEKLISRFVVESTDVMGYIELDTEADVATIMLTGPDGKWFAMGLGAPDFVMANLPYTLIVDGAGGVVERRLADHHHGDLLAPSVEVVLNTVTNGRRAVVLKRPMKGLTKNHYTFDPSCGTIASIFASGKASEFGYHGPSTRTGVSIHFVAVGRPTCLCEESLSGSINGVPFHKDCLPPPKGDLLAEENPVCWVNTYQGGLACCHHQVVLLDTDQVQPPGEMTYRLKFRFWFQEYVEASSQSVASHDNLIRIYWQTEAYATEYHIRQCVRSRSRDNAGSSDNENSNSNGNLDWNVEMVRESLESQVVESDECVHTIRASFTLRDMFTYNNFNCDVRSNPTCWGDVDNHQGAFLIYIAGHCHAPSCLSMELYNADTGELLCRHEPVYGTGQHGQFDELGYLAIPPCLFGPEEEGLWPPIFLSYDTKLFSIKKNNNTYAHLGEMASWQMRGYLAYSNQV